MLLSGFCQVAVCNLKPLDADSGASVRAGLSEVPWSQLATSSTAIRMHLFQPASQSAIQQAKQLAAATVSQATAGGRQVTHASTSISCGRAAGEICLFGYANHNADRLTQQITQFHCACHTYTNTPTYIHIYPYPGQLGICVVMRCAVKRSAAGRQSSTINLMTSTIKMKTETDAKQPPPYLPPHPL